MRYENSLTSNVKDYIANTLAQKISAAHNRCEISNSARDIRRFLCDASTLNTPDFVIRRFIQAQHQELLPSNRIIPNLLEGRNVSWDKDILDALAKALAARSKEYGTNISKKEWERYFAGNGASKREKVFQIAFTLDMDVESTIDLLLAFDMEAYSVRYPLDFLCLFCQKKPGKYHWAEVEEMLNDFLKKRISEPTVVSSPQQGMTRKISSDLDAIFAENLPDADAKGELLKYMIAHGSEFVSYKETVSKALRNADGKIKKDENNKTVKATVEQDVFLHGYSLSRMDGFMRLAEYLAVLFPNYSWQMEVEPGENTQDVDLKDWGPRGMSIVSVEIGEDQKPKLASLMRAAFANNEWNVVWGSTTNSAKEFEDSMRKLFHNYEQHMMAIDRLREGKNSVEFFKRRDALMFAYFLFNGYIKLVSASGTEAQSKYEVIDEMLNSGDDFDYAIAEALEKAEYVFQYSDDEDSTALRFKSLVESFNLILTQLGYMNLYLPARFDRFVVLSLMSSSPDELTPLIMSEDELIDFEMEDAYTTVLS